MTLPGFACLVGAVAVLMAGFTAWAFACRSKLFRKYTTRRSSLSAFGHRPITGSSRKDAAIIFVLWIAVAGSSLALLQAAQ